MPKIRAWGVFVDSAHCQSLPLTPEAENRPRDHTVLPPEWRRTGETITISDTQQDMEVLAAVPENYGQSLRLRYPASHPAPVSPSLAEEQGGEQFHVTARQPTHPTTIASRVCQVGDALFCCTAPPNEKGQRSAGSVSAAVLPSFCCSPDWWARGRSQWPPRL